MSAADSIARAIRLYESGQTLARIAPQVGVSAEQVRRWLIRSGVALRPRGYGANPGIVHDFFRTINTDAKAWCLGLIGSDGNVNHKRLRVTLHSRDREVLEQMRGLLAPGVAVKDFTAWSERQGAYVPRSMLQLHSVQMIADLLRHGVTPAKSLTYKPWGGPPPLMPAYWRGMTDGDGSWWCRKKNPSRWGLSLCGTQQTCEAFAEFCRSVGATAVVVRQRSIWVAKCEGTLSCQRVARSLYAGGTISLIRKRAKVDVLLAVNVRELRDWSGVGDDELRRLHGELGSWGRVARSLDTTPANLANLRDRRGYDRESKGGRPSTFKDMTADRLLALKESLGSWHKVALHLGHKTGTVFQLRQRLGLC